MAGRGTRKCRICGKEYTFCKDTVTLPGVFRWQDVACCPEHGAQYLEDVLRARGELPDQPKKTRKAKERKETE